MPKKTKPPKTYTEVEFIKRYNKLVDEMGWWIVGNPEWVKSNDGSPLFVVQINLSIQPKV